MSSVGEATVTIFRVTVAVCESEEKVDDIAERLQKLCIMLEDNSRPKANKSTTDLVGSSGSYQIPADSGTSLQGSQRDPQTPRDQVEYEGDSSLAAHADFTTRVLENAVTTNLPISHYDEMASMMKDIRNTIRTVGTLNTDMTGACHGTPHAGEHFAQESLPPVQLTLNCLRMLKETPMMRYFWMMQFESVGQVTEQLLGVYSTDRAPSMAELIIAYIGLYWLFTQSGQFSTDTSVQRTYLNYGTVCQSHADHVLSQLSFHLPTSVEYILALTMATEYCMGQSKPTMAWTYISTASRMSQAMGLHRTASQRDHSFDSETRQKSKLFWAMFILEKNLSLQLGRSSTLRDHDITVPLKAIKMGYQVGGSLGVLSPKWLRISQIEGRVYDEIYSPEALHHDANTRNSRARSLIADLKEVINDADSYETEFLQDRRRVLGNTFDDIFIQCDKISHLTLLSSTFVPFFVILCNVIWTVNAADLELLDALVSSLEAGQDRDTFSTNHLLKTFKPLYSAAFKYIEAKSHSASGVMSDNITFEMIYHQTAPVAEPVQWHNISALTSLDQFMSHSAPSATMALDGTGFADLNDSSSTSHAQPTGVNTGDGNLGQSGTDHQIPGARTQAAQLEEWFLQSRHVMDMMEDGRGDS
ncbi:C6 transcription factor [Colletotrichum chrysophilum]|uniref:C6 transcription factor n=1 Tax=Colletotrichum chrysophilum TaxID=1836956 RepID=A0AAD9AXR6_9PEZI|nr:C6 transcription factor [Colletotrichum chrysophilum]